MVQSKTIFFTSKAKHNSILLCLLPFAEIYTDLAQRRAERSRFLQVWKHKIGHIQAKKYQRSDLITAAVTRNQHQLHICRLTVTDGEVRTEETRGKEEWSEPVAVISACPLTWAPVTSLCRSPSTPSVPPPLITYDLPSLDCCWKAKAGWKTEENIL